MAEFNKIQYREMELSVLLLLVVAFVFLFILVRTVNKIWWKPLRIKKYFESQGISGPPYRLLYGNTMEVIRMMEKVNSAPMELSSHDILPRVLPEIHYWTNVYGGILCNHTCFSDSYTR